MSPRDLLPISPRRLGSPRANRTSGNLLESQCLQEGGQVSLDPDSHCAETISTVSGEANGPVGSTQEHPGLSTDSPAS